MTRYAGIVYRSLDQRLLHLSLQEVDVRVWMVDGELERDPHSSLIRTALHSVCKSHGLSNFRE